MDKDNKGKKDKQKKIYKIITLVISGLIALIGLISQLVSQNDNEKSLETQEISVINVDRGIYIKKNEGSVIYNEKEEEQKIPPSIQIVPLDFDYAYFSDGHKIYFFEDEAYDSSKTYTLDESYVAMLHISNEGENEIVLYNFKFVAENIEVDYDPYLRTYAAFEKEGIVWDANSSNRDGWNYSISIANEGWGDAHNLNIELFDDNGMLNELFDGADQFGGISLLKSGQTAQIKLLKHENMKWDVLDDYLENIEEISIFPYMKIWCDEKDFGEIEGNGSIIYTRDGIYSADGQGAPSLFAYGILIDTSDSSDEYECNISESIEGDKILQMPICFFPDKSCVLDYYIEFSVRDGSENYQIRTEKQSVKFYITPFDNIVYHDGRYINNADSFYNHSMNDTFITYPYGEMMKVTDDEYINYLGD